MQNLGVKARVVFSDQLSPVVYTGALVSWKAARIVDRRKRSDGDSERKSAEQVVSNVIRF
jgi:phenylacetate-CoA ligase